MSSVTSVKAIEIDARGPRFSAAITTVVLALALVTESIWVIAFQAVVFAIDQAALEITASYRRCAST
ncbi:hypothetical protein GM50_22345 [freshwater metagenome]|uniref:DUF4395 domain-containing protein n=1 Tax=freshwater metagenome TaxID=449393 RepID=A0A094QGL1_9ZZZZ